jgi:hypothetical protein
MKTTLAVSKLYHNYCASLNDALFHQKSDYAGYTHEQAAAVCFMTTVAGPIKVVHSIGIAAAGVIVAIVPGLEFKAKTRLREFNSAERAEITKFTPTFNFHSPFKCYYQYEDKTPDGYPSMYRGYNHVPHLSFTPGFSLNGSRNKKNKPALTTDKVTVTGLQMVATGATKAVEGLIETVGAIPMGIYHCNEERKKRKMK